MGWRQDMSDSLLRLLNRHGWRRVRVEHRPAAREASEVWQLESVASPRSGRAYLAFRDETGIVGRRVEVMHQPPEVAAGQPRWGSYYLGRNWRTAFPRLVAALAYIRDRLPARNDVTDDQETPADDRPGDSVCVEVERRLRYFRDRLSDRQFRLFACACLRRLGQLTENEANLRAVEAMEQCADGLARRRDVRKARKAARLPWLSSVEPFDEALCAVRAAALVATQEQQADLPDLLDDVAGRPESVTLRPSWLRHNGGIVAVMARTIYTDRSFDDLPILADALEEAGCKNTLILKHCRRPGAHMRGCWVVDLLLGLR